MSDENETAAWMTETVRGLIETARRTQDYAGTLPILADALQDAGYPPGDRLDRLRGPLAYPDACREVCYLLGGEYQKAAWWLEKFADEFGGYHGWVDDPASADRQAARDKVPPRITYDVLVTAGCRYLDGEGPVVEYGINWTNVFLDHEEEFWNHFEVVTGRQVEDKSAQLFECDCGGDTDWGQQWPGPA